MALSPWVLHDPFLESYRPSRLWELDEWSPWDRDLRRLARFPDYIRRNLSSVLQDSDAQIKFDEDKFQVNVDVQQFAPNEITVKTSGDNTITVEGKHEERPDEHGYVSRHFVRRYVLPKGHDINQAVSKLSSDGVLTITAPRVGQPGIEQRTIPITQTGQPSKAVENKSSNK